MYTNKEMVSISAELSMEGSILSDVCPVTPITNEDVQNYRIPYRERSVFTEIT